MPNNKIKFGIDIDGTVTSPSALIPHINQGFNVNLTLADIKEYDLTRAFDVDPVVFSKWWKTVEEEIYATSPIHTTAAKVLTDWQHQFELLYISARATQYTTTTKQWFEQHQVPFDELHCIGSHEKVATAKRLQVEAFFEDKHDNAVAIYEELGIPVLLFDTPWNQEPIPSGVIRVDNWQQANEQIRRIFHTL